MKSRGQGALEYLLLIGGAVLIAAVVITLAINIGGGGVSSGQDAALDALCLKFADEQACNDGDPDGTESDSCGTGDCTWDPISNTCKGTAYGVRTNTCFG